MKTKNVLYAAVGAPVVAARKVGNKANDVYGKLGLAYRKINKRKHAREMLEKQNASIDEIYSTTLVDLYLELNEWETAEEFYKKHIAEDGDPSNAYYGLARIMAYGGKIDDACNNLENAAEHGLNDAELLKDKKYND